MGIFTDGDVKDEHDGDDEKLDDEHVKTPGLREALELVVHVRVRPGESFDARVKRVEEASRVVLAFAAFHDHRQHCSVCVAAVITLGAMT